MVKLKIHTNTKTGQNMVFLPKLKFDFLEKEGKRFIDIKKINFR